MPGNIDIGSLSKAVLEEMERLNYSKETVKYARRLFASFGRFAERRGDEVFSEKLAVDFLHDKFGTDIAQLYAANPGGSYMKGFLRAMRMLLEWSECGCICKRMPGELKRTELPPGLQELLDSFNDASRAGGCSESTVYSRGGRVKHFLLFLADGGGVDASCITGPSAHDYILAKSSCHAKSVKTMLTAVRCFLRHLYLRGLTPEDYSATVPNPKLYYAPALPASWTEREVGSLLESIDRGGPNGLRDYAMLLMVARLGLRASDIKSIRMSDIDWDARTMTVVQHKTGVPLSLPLLDDVGWAVIDYLRSGRPRGADCPELFVRHVAPFDPFGDTSNLTNMLSRRAREAGVLRANDRKTLHSLRHALAKRLLDQRVPLDDISRILGHVNKRTTSIYLRMDVASLAKCPLDPEGV